MSENKSQQQLDMNETLSKSEAFVVKNKKKLIGGVILIVVLVAGFMLYGNFVSGPKNEKAGTMLAKGQQYFATNEYDKALNGDGNGYIGFLKIIKEYSGTDAANLANLYAGLSFAQQDKAKEAIPYLEKFSTQDDDMVSAAAISALGNCYAKEKQLDKAVETLKKAAKLADNNSLSPIYLLEAGMILESQKKNSEAKDLYQQIKDNYYESPIAQEIDKYIERASTAK